MILRSFFMNSRNSHEMIIFGEGVGGVRKLLGNDNFFLFLFGELKKSVYLCTENSC